MQLTLSIYRYSTSAFSITILKGSDHFNLFFVLISFADFRTANFEPWFLLTEGLCRPLNNLSNESMTIFFSSLLTLLPCSMVGSDSSATNYPGKIPSGEDAPSDLACTTPDGLPN